MCSAVGQTFLCFPVPASALDLCSRRNWRGALFLQQQLER